MLGILPIGPTGLVPVVPAVHVAHEQRIFMPQPDVIDAAVVGTGPAGLAAALALAWSGVEVALIGPAPTSASLGRETRTTALFGGSIDFLRHIGVWDDLEDGAEALSGLRLVDDTGGLLRAPETLFQSDEIGRAAFGYNIANATLVRALFARVVARSGIPFIDGTVTSVSHEDDGVMLAIADGRTSRARLVVAADGRQSLCRSAAGISAEAWSYPQSAITTLFAHARPHGGISTELHRRAGPLTTVPMRGNVSSLVWVDTPAEATRLAGLGKQEFGRELETRLGGFLGAIGDIGPRATFPLSGLSAKPLAHNRTVLIGEAGHVLPPIGAQGLNLGFRDAAWVADIAGTAKRELRDIGGNDVLRAYDTARSGDVATRTLAIDLLNRSLFTGLLPFDVLRGAGLALVGAIGPLRRMVMREGMEPSGRVPRLLEAASQH